MAHRKAGGSAKSLRDSKPKYLGIKRGNGSAVRTGEILVRQRGLKILPGSKVSVGNDHTLFAMQDGTVRFTATRKTNFTGKTKNRVVANVE
ncbi:MAG: 50S ribosomal protein L27 [Candidatus Kaiserbacteria bacterium]|nr:50S ribosomal protein L27 [Candidatus Kaiserbacteria bacterium]